MAEHRYENCRDDGCESMLCRAWKEAWKEAYAEGRADGYAEGLQAGAEIAGGQ